MKQQVQLAIPVSTTVPRNSDVITQHRLMAIVVIAPKLALLVAGLHPITVQITLADFRVMRNTFYVQKTLAVVLNTSL